MKCSMTHLLLTLGMRKGTQWLSMRILIASSAISLTSEGERAALRPWSTLNQEKSLTPNS